VFQQFDSHTGGGDVAGVFFDAGPPEVGRLTCTEGKLIVLTLAKWHAPIAVVLLTWGWLAQAAAPTATTASPPGGAASALQAGPAHGLAAKPVKPVKAAKLIDLNNASKSELKTLPGIGDAEAERIIAKRPYNSKAGIVSDAGIPAGVFLANKRSIFVGRIAKSKPKAKA
jgi:hypothetical protein